MNLPLPGNLVAHVREFASDKVGIHPTAEIIKELSFQYKAATYAWGIYKPDRVLVTKQGRLILEIFQLPYWWT